MTHLKRQSFLSFLSALALFSSLAALPVKAADLVVAADGSGDFQKVQDAIDAVPANRATRTVILIKPGTYKEKLRVPSDRKMLSLVGESYETTTLTFDDYGGKTSDYASTRILADDFYAQNLTFQNTIDSRSGVKGGQAAALRIDGDRTVFNHCRIMGFQDTYYTGGNKRSYHKNCVIEGTTDFIYGDGIALFEDCTIVCRKSSTITAHSQKLQGGKHANKFGYVFQNCKIQKHPDEKVTNAALGRPWGNAARVVFLNCELGAHIRAEGWSEWRGRSNHPTSFYAEYKNRGPGFQPDMRLPWTHQLTDTKAAQYTRENIFKANTTTAVKLVGDWNPDLELLAANDDVDKRQHSTRPFGGVLDGERPRVIVSTDIGGSDPDDFQSLVHLFLYADVIDVEGLISSPPNAGRAEDIIEVIEAYTRDYSKLMRHSTAYPAPEILRRVTKQGAFDRSPEQGWGKSTEGSRWIVERAQAVEKRPLWILVWGSITDVAQAVHDAPSIKSKIRVYSIGSWNTKHDSSARDYLFNNHSDLWWIENDTTFRGMYMGGMQDGEWGNISFVANNVKDHGSLGDLFFRKKRDIKMGDTPSFLYLLRGNTEDPTGPHWGGAFVKTDHGKHFWTDNPEERFSTNQRAGAKTVSVWRRDYLEDWKRRMDRVTTP